MIQSHATPRRFGAHEQIVVSSRGTVTDPASMAIILFLLVSAIGVSSWFLWRRLSAGRKKTLERRPAIGATPQENSTRRFAHDGEPVELESEHKSGDINSSSVGMDARECGKDLDWEENEQQAQLPINVAGELESVEPRPDKTDAVLSVEKDQTQVSGELPAANSAPEFLPDLVEVHAKQHEPAVTGKEEVMAEASVAESPVAPAKAPETGSSLLSDKAPVGTTVAISTESSDGELTVVGIATGQLGPAEAPEDYGETEEAPQRYRPPAQKPPQQKREVRPATQGSKGTGQSEIPLQICVRLTFDRFGVVNIELLPERTSGLDNEIEVKLGGTSLLLVAQENWYEPPHVADIGRLLRTGVEVKGVLANQDRVRWLLTGRDVYVLASHPRASGFVSTNRLVLGRSHVVLCVQELLPEVEAILNGAECIGYTKLAETDGIPSGWVGLRGVTPAKAIPLGSGTDPFYPIKPAPDIEIDLEGGVCLHSSVWLAGYPPEIRVFGDSNTAVRVLIDGKEAQRTKDGLLVVDGYELCGQHSVYCEGLSCSSTYSIEEPPSSWDAWPAFHYGQAEICGPLVQTPPEAAGRHLATIPMSNPVLLGAQPGEIFFCSHRSVAYWKGLVPFDVVWALPLSPLHCDKNTSRILQFARTPVVPANTGTKRMLEWSAAILDASRKGMRIQSESTDSAALWRDYKRIARNIWRATR